ncbi:hypothetical protein TRVA0_051S00166 [Trichomonascus vanleenenianus]|uniref:uncharacterized protein n=1 Tax=Trichomonascus vanleenenianus TaxID=2268995 RepID=UPI003EC9C674
MATRKSWEGIPQTPGPASWALKSIPTLFFGTPKVEKHKDDKVFRDLTKELQATAQKISTAPAASTPQSKRPGNGILKTPGTTGPAKSVAFTGSFMDDTTSQESVKRVDTPAPKPQRIRSGLPANFPGKFPSPWTPKVANYDDDQDGENEDPDDSFADHKSRKKADRDKSNNILDVEPKSEAELVSSIVNLLKENNERLEQLNGGYEKDISGSIVKQLEEQTKYAIDYAKLRDKELVEYRSKYSELLRKQAEQFEDYEKKFNSLKSASSEPSLKSQPARKFGSVPEGNMLESTAVLNRENDMLRQKISALEERHSHSETETNSELRELRKEYGALSRMTETLERENRSLRRAIHDNRREKDLEAELHASKRQIALLEQQLEAQKAANERRMHLSSEPLTSSTMLETEKERDKYKRENIELRQQMFDLENENQALKQSNNALGREANQLKSRIGQLEITATTNSNDLKHHASLLTKKLAQKEDDLIELRRTLQSHDTKFEELTRMRAENIQSVATLRTLSNRLEEKEANIKRLISTVDEQGHTLSILRSQLHERENAIRSLEMQLEQQKHNNPSSSTSSAPPVKDSHMMSIDRSQYPAQADLISLSSSPRQPREFSDYQMRNNDSLTDSSAMSITQKSLSILGDETNQQACKQRLKDPQKLEASLKRLNARRVV